MKGSFIFAGGVITGFVTCGILGVRAAIKSDSIREIIKNKVKSKIVDGVELILYGDEKCSSKQNKSVRVDYNHYYSRQQEDTPEVVFDTRRDAETVLYELDKIINEYGCASRLDLYSLSGIRGNSSDSNYGWTDVKNIGIVKTASGYRLELPNAIDLRLRR